MANNTPANVVIRINDKEVTNSLRGITAEVKKLERELNGMTLGTEEWNKKLSEVNEAKKHLENVRAEMGQTKKAASELNAETNTLGGTFGNLENKLTDTFSSVLSGQVSFKSLGSTIKVFAAESWAAIGSIPIIGWLAAVAAGIGLVIKEAIEYNKEISPLLKLLDNLGLDKKIIPQLRAIKDAFGVETEQIANMMDSLVDAGVVKDQAAALDDIMIALAKAPDKAGLISFLEGSAKTARDLGLDLRQLINIKQDLENTPVNPEKVFGGLDTFVNRFLSQSEKIIPQLEKTFGGDFGQKIYKGLIDGTIKYDDALKKIYDQGEKLKISDKERADVAKALFGKSGASAQSYNDILKTISDSYRKLDQDLTESQKKTLDLANTYKELEKAKDDAFNSSTMRAFMFDLKKFWIQSKTVFFDFISGVVNGFKLIGYNIANSFNAVPQIFKALKNGIVKDLYSIGDAANSLWTAIKNGATGNLDEAGKAWEKFKNQVKSGMNGDNYKEFNSFFGASGSINQKTLKEIYNSNAQKAAAADLLDSEKPGNRNTPYSLTKDSAGKSKSGKNSAADDKKRELDQIIKDEEEAHKKLLELQEQYQDDKTKLIEDAFLKEAQAEIDRRNQEETKNLQEIADLEKKKLTTKSVVAKAEFQKSIDLLHQIEIQNEEAHQKNMLTIQQKWDAKLFEDFVKAEQRKIEESRRLDEDAINEISTMEEAEQALSQMKYLKLTDQELKGIKTLEDAKRALREDADRKMLAASLVSLEQQKAQLEEALKGMTGEAAEKLKADLDTLNAKITGLKGAINGGTEADAKKVQEEGDAAKGAVDVLGFSVLDWENCFKNLDTTEGKLRAVGMAFQALSNAGQMFADLTRSLAEKDMRKFEQIQNKKKADLLNQLNTGYITNEQYNKEIQKMEAETANKKAEMEYKQAKADKVAKMFSIIGSTAVGVAKALPNLVLAGIVGGMGLLQLGIVAAQPLPERPSFADGGFTGSGFGSPDKSGFKPAGIVHEGEWTAPKWMVESPRTARVIDYLESVRQGKTTPMAEGGFSQSETSSATTAPTPLSENNSNSELMPVLYRLGNFLEYLITKGVYIEKNPENGKEAKEMIEMWDELKNKNKH